MGLCSSTDAADQGSSNTDSSSVPRKQTQSQYQIVRTLGVGASCQVVMAKDRKTKKKYALKMLKKVDPNDPQTTDNDYLFHNEIKVLKQLKHENILEYVEAYEDDSFFNVVTVLCEGGELFDRVSERSFSEHDAAQLTKQMLKGLKHCHDRNISHRDLKPENFVFESKDADSTMRLIDFGCAVQAKDSEVIKDVAGSPYYVAPEVLDNSFKRTGATWKAADMWSIGVIVFLLLHGYPPFNGETQDKIFSKIAKARFKFNSHLKLSNDAKGLIKKLLIKQPDQRLTAAEALQHPWIADDAVAPKDALPAEVINGLKEFSQNSKLKRAVARMLVGQMSDRDKGQLMEVFKRFDKNGDGKLSGDEISEMLAFIGKKPEDAKQMLEQYDDDNSGDLDFKEFQEMHAASQEVDEKTAREMFKKFDKDGNGKVDADEIQKMLRISAAEARQMIEEVDDNGDGEVDFEEWLKVMANQQRK